MLAEEQGAMESADKGMPTFEEILDNLCEKFQNLSIGGEQTDAETPMDEGRLHELRGLGEKTGDAIAAGERGEQTGVETPMERLHELRDLGEKMDDVIYAGKKLDEKMDLLIKCLIRETCMYCI